MNDFTTVEQDNGITGAYAVDRRGDWHLVARSDLPGFTGVEVNTPRQTGCDDPALHAEGGHDV
jgi:hypothetical protein